MGCAVTLILDATVVCTSVALALALTLGRLIIPVATASFYVFSGCFTAANNCLTLRTADDFRV